MNKWFIEFERSTAYITYYLDDNNYTKAKKMVVSNGKWECKFSADNPEEKKLIEEFSENYTLENHENLLRKYFNAPEVINICVSVISEQCNGKREELYYKEDGKWVMLENKYR